MTQPWRVPRLVLPADEEPGRFLPADCLPMNTGCDGPIISDFAREVLDILLRPAGEFWPVDVLGHRYWWFNCLAVAEALDTEQTEADWGSVESGPSEIRWILAPHKLVFHAGQVEGAPPMFRVPELPYGVLFARECVGQAVMRHQLTGFQLDQVWSSSDGGVSNPAGFDFSEAWPRVPAGKLERKRALARATLQERQGK